MESTRKCELPLKQPQRACPHVVREAEDPLGDVVVGAVVDGLVVCGVEVMTSGWAWPGDSKCSVRTLTFPCGALGTSAASEPGRHELKRRTQIGVGREDHAGVIAAIDRAGDEVHSLLDVDALLLRALLWPVLRVSKRARNDDRPGPFPGRALSHVRRIRSGLAGG